MSDTLIRKSDRQPQDDLPLEVVERKGFGHPDTLCDVIAEFAGEALREKYLEVFGRVLHYNVDKVLLRGGRAAPKFGGGTLLEPIGIYLAGRATNEAFGRVIDIPALLEGRVRQWFGRHIPTIDSERDLRVECLIRPGSADLIDLFDRDHVPRSNDTSIGVGFAPLSKIESLVKSVELWLNSLETRLLHPEAGRDVKVMGVRRGDRYELIVAVAMVARHIPDLATYQAKIKALTREIRDFASLRVGTPVEVLVNAADQANPGSVYLTVTGLSAEAGDDGEVGRGNRYNGLITPFRPMTMEAYAGKNSVSHTGRIYQVAAQRIADRASAKIAELTGIACTLLSKIGAPISEPEVADLEYSLGNGARESGIADALGSILQQELDSLTFSQSQRLTHERKLR